MTEEGREKKRAYDRQWYSANREKKRVNLPHVLCILLAAFAAHLYWTWNVEGGFKPVGYFLKQSWVWWFIAVRDFFE